VARFPPRWADGRIPAQFGERARTLGLVVMAWYFVVSVFIVPVIWPL
jgi:hypothetical protein